MKQLEDKVALVTGAAQGMGRAIALRLAEAGADIGIVDLNNEKMESVAEEIRKIGRKATAFKADVSDPDQIADAVLWLVSDSDSDSSSYVLGHTLPVDGGTVLGGHTTNMEGIE